MAEKKADDELVLGLFTPSFCHPPRLRQRRVHQGRDQQGLSYAIITGSLILKLPQILKILSAKDVTGLTPSAFYMEVHDLQRAARLPSLDVGRESGDFGAKYPPGTAALVVLHAQDPGVHAVWPRARVCCHGSRHVVHSRRVSVATGVRGIPVSIVARIPQILSNFKQGHTGQLALITLVLNLAGSIARLFTTMQETGDPVQVAGFGVAILLNSTLVLQVLLFWGATNKALAQTTKKKEHCSSLCSDCVFSTSVLTASAISCACVNLLPVFSITGFLFFAANLAASCEARRLISDDSDDFLAVDDRTVGATYSYTGVVSATEATGVLFTAAAAFRLAGRG
ncbi:Mannose-P-dolichol utilization defect 1 protein [Phytophthora cactorum]|nr:Mannose-P-dolichol utilization defect 1 protein [Phytophthora cactorum]